MILFPAENDQILPNTWVLYKTALAAKSCEIALFVSETRGTYLDYHLGNSSFPFALWLPCCSTEGDSTLPSPSQVAGPVPTPSFYAAPQLPIPRCNNSDRTIYYFNRFK